jgi:hypothetical protein
MISSVIEEMPRRTSARADVSGVATRRELARLAARDVRHLRDRTEATGREWVRLTLIAQLFDRRPTAHRTT